MKLNRKQKDAIRAHYGHYYRLYFMPDGGVMAQKSQGSARGLLYTPKQTVTHLRAVSLIKG